MTKRGPQRRKPGGAMFGLFFALLAMFLGLWFLGVGYALAQSGSPPGSGHGFLIDKHTAAKVDCHACHVEEPASKPPEMAMCLSCHGGTYSRLAATTQLVQPNPHASHQGPIPCSVCHHVHSPSRMFRNNCHNVDLTPP